MALASTHSEKQPDPVDIHVGQRIRLRRTLLGKTQQWVGDQVGLKFQQITKYESGQNRVAASRLYQFAHILGVPVSFFFDDMPGADTKPANDIGTMQRQHLGLIRHYQAITDPKVKAQVYALVKAIGGAERQAIE